VSIISWCGSARRSGRFLPFFLLITVALALSGLISETGGVSFVRAQQTEKAGIAPQVGQWAYITTAVQRFIMIDKWALLPLVTTLVVLSINIAGKYVSALSQAALPQTHRLQYMIPMYFSTYT
jgi:hypothetical protein